MGVSPVFYQPHGGYFCTEGVAGFAIFVWNEEGQPIVRLYWGVLQGM